METFAAPRQLIDNPEFAQHKRNSLVALNDDMIDPPIIGIVNSINSLPYCFTLQCCHGHFVYAGQPHRHNIAPLPETRILSDIEYRLAYIAFCIDTTDAGRHVYAVLEQLTAIDPGTVQLGSAQWFWDRQINSYALQVMPRRFQRQDTAILGYEEALEVEKIRNEVFFRLGSMLQDI